MDILLCVDYMFVRLYFKRPFFNVYYNGENNSELFWFITISQNSNLRNHSDCRKLIIKMKVESCCLKKKILLL